MGRQDRSPGSRLKIARPTQRKLPLALPALLISLLPILLVQRVGLPMGRYLVRSGWASCRREPGYFRLRYCPCSLRCGALRLPLSRAVATVRSSLPRCSIRVGYRQVFPVLKHTLDRRICSADICIFLECVAARQQTRLCRWFRIRMRIGNLARFKALYLAKSYEWTVMERVP